MLNRLDFNVYLVIVLAFVALIQNDDQIAFLETEWFQSYWTISIPIAALYIGIVHLGKRKSGQPIRGNGPLLKYWAAHNMALFIFSVLGAYRVGGEFLQTLSGKGFVATFCDNDYFHTRSVYFWYFLFVTSKSFEMGDTFFLLAANKPVRFIHWYHHAVTMIYSFYIAAYLPAIGRWMSSMNFCVHSLMYSYYFVSSYGVRVPRKISMVITTLQTAQMFVGLTINTLAFVSKHRGQPCSNGGYTVEAGILMYISYVFLFVDLFRKTYFRQVR